MNQIGLDAESVMFQYNDCLGSSKKSNSDNDTFNLFQYNDCLGSSHVGEDSEIQNLEFQYNDCLGSSKKVNTICKTVNMVSIQRLFGFVCKTS